MSVKSRKLLGAEKFVATGSHFNKSVLAWIKHVWLGPPESCR